MSPPRVLVVGGGPAGVGVALSLLSAGVRPLVIERSTALRDKPGECLTSDFRPLLERLGLVDLLAAHRRVPAFYSRWDRDEIVARDAISSPRGEGWLLDRRRFEAQLIRATCERGAILQLGWTVTELRSGDGCWAVASARSGERRMVDADYVIDATGRSAQLLRMLGEPRPARDRLLGSWLVTSSRGRGDGPVLVEADAEGWWYATALPDGRTSLVWFSDRAETSREVLLTRARERALVASLVTEDPGDAGGLAPSVHPAGSARALRACGPGWFAVGDAALAFDPLSSHGIGSALGTGYYAAQALLAEHAGEQDARSRYQAQLDAHWAAYLVPLAERYAAPHSWTKQRFWVERRARISAMGV